MNEIKNKTLKLQILLSLMHLRGEGLFSRNSIRDY